IVVPNNKFRQCVAVEKSKNLLERCQRITPLDRPGRREAASRHLRRSHRAQIKTTSTISRATTCGAFSRKVAQASVAVIVSPYNTAAAVRTTRAAGNLTTERAVYASCHTQPC